MTPTPSTEKHSMFRALRNPNYRLYFLGQGISLVGTWMQQVALSWLTYKLTGSPALLGIVAFSGQIPSLIVTPFAGALADRLNRHRLLIITQSLAMLQALILAALTLTGHITVTGIILLGIFAGLITASDMPTRQAFLVELVEDPENLGNAIALNSSLMNAARLIGPAIAGGLVAWVGEGVCFLINGLSYIAVIIALMRIRVPERPVVEAPAPLLSHMKEGFTYVFNHTPIRAIILFTCAMSLFGMSYAVLLPVYAKDILHGDAGTLGMLLAGAGTGALGAGLLLANRRQVMGLGRWVIAASTAFSLTMLAFHWVTSLAASVALLTLIGFSMMIQIGGCNILVQTFVEEGKRGRVMSLFTLSFLGMMPIGNLAVGYLGEHLGVINTFVVSGACCLLASLWLASQVRELRAAVRPIYIEKGLLPAADPVVARRN
ncbi:MAG: MFS transporter [Candidatus Melainabacteria bacterium]